MHASQKQQGATLVALMVGLLISMMILGASMALFKNVSSTTINIREDASADGKAMSSTLSAAMALLDAGYGLTNPQLGTNIVVLSGATLSTGNVLSGTQVTTGTTRSGNALVWETKPSGTLQCAGLYAPASGGLFSLPALSCTAATGFASLTWVPVTLVPAPQASSSTTRQDSSIPVVVTLIAKAQSCKPFGLTSTNANLLVTLSVDSSSGQREALTLDQCLFNFFTP